MTFHGGGFPSSAAGRLAHPRSFAGFALRRLDHVIAVNREIETVFHRYGVSRNRTSVIEPHTILHPEQIPTSEAAMTALDPNMRAFVMSATPLLVAVVHFEPEYLLPLHLDAVEALRSQFPRAGLLILGNGSQRRAVEDEIRTRGLRSHVYVSGDVPHEQCVAGMRVADVVLRLTAYDGDSIAVREALQLGRPVVATAVAPRPSGVTLVQSHTGTCVADAIVETLRADVQPEEDLNGEIHMARILQLYRSLSE
jgi:glycosyltransferase involved in cell wall biosynthesis